MNSYIKMVIVLLLTVLILTACQSSSNDTEINPESINSEDNESEHKSAESSEDDENSSIIEKQENDSLKIDDSTDQKDIFLEKLQKANDEVNQLKPKDSSMYALKEVENKRYEIWDDLLNEIYGDLEDQLSKDEMNLLREEQRSWITYRDDTALEASLEYKGGTQEHLEYVAILANLTEERCYELVEDYMT